MILRSTFLFLIVVAVKVCIILRQHAAKNSFLFFSVTHKLYKSFRSFDYEDLHRLILFCLFPAEALADEAVETGELCIEEWLDLRLILFKR